MVVCVASLVGCSGASADGEPAPPSQCDKNARVGTYMTSFMESAGGSCGPVQSSLINFSPEPAAVAAGPAANCVVNSERWSEGDCKLERDVTCNDASGPTHTIMVSRAKTADADTIGGTMSITISGRSACQSTYTISAVRQ